MIKITVKNREGAVRRLEIPEGEHLNLMETLKTLDYEMRATCGGMALCADCHCKIIDGGHHLPQPKEEELVTLDLRPDASTNSRLACQLKVDENLQGLYIQLMSYV